GAGGEGARDPAGALCGIHRRCPHAGGARAGAPRAAELPRGGRRVDGARAGRTAGRRDPSVMDAKPEPRSGAGKPLALGPTDIARLASMSVRARVIVEGAFAGMHQNPHAGSSIEFSEHKEYAPGDDIRRIDWKAVGRRDRYYIKRFEDETEMRTFLLVD